jgi:probable phosphoglycerate mutase
VIVWVIRHGETELNARRVVQPAATPLSERGREQARRVARRLAREGIAHILSSDLLRARETAEVLRRATGSRVELEPLLQERNFGDVRGTPYAELGFDLFAPDFEPPNGESWEVFHARVARAWARVEATASGLGGGLAVVTHGLVCRGFVGRHMHPGEGGAALSVPLRWGNTSVTCAHGPAPWRVALLNCTAHLDEVTADAAV